MNVETYFEEHNAPLVYDVQDNQEWKDQIDALELEGQQSIMEGEAKSPIPYTYMKETMKRMFKTICPLKVKIEDYKSMPIPLRILKEVALCKQENYFNEIQVWSDDVDPDPLVVGRKGDSEWSGTFYMIGRWGDVLLPLVELKKVASERLALKLELEKEQAVAKLNASNPQLMAELYLSGKDSRDSITTSLPF